MMNILNKFPFTFRSGEALSADRLNSLVNNQNSIIDTLNNLLRSFCDINQETGQQVAYTLQEAVNLVPQSRRGFTMKIRFIENTNPIIYAEYFYCGPKSITPESWSNTENWSKDVPTIIDGGTW